MKTKNLARSVLLARLQEPSLDIRACIQTNLRARGLQNRHALARLYIDQAFPTCGLDYSPLLLAELWATRDHYYPLAILVSLCAQAVVCMESLARLFVSPDLRLRAATRSKVQPLVIKISWCDIRSDLHCVAQTDASRARWDEATKVAHEVVRRLHDERVASSRLAGVADDVGVAQVPEVVRATVDVTKRRFHPIQPTDHHFMSSRMS